MPGFEPKLIKNFYSEDMVALAQMQINLLKAAGLGEIDEQFNRRWFHKHPLFVALHELQKKKVEEIIGRPLKLSYCGVSMYFEGTGKCDRHTDRPQCKYTVDVCFNQKEPWPFFAETEQPATAWETEKIVHKLIMEPGDAIILSGTDHPHWREPIQPGNFCDLVFFHYVDADYSGSLD